MLFLTGAFDNVSVVIRQTILQVMTPRLCAAESVRRNQIFISLLNQIGAFESGLAAKLWARCPLANFWRMYDFAGGGNVCFCAQNEKAENVISSLRL